MNDLARQKLVKLVETQPRAVLEDSERFEAFLRDYCGECKPEISAIIAALEEEIPEDLRRMRNQPYPLLKEQLANRLQDERSIHEEAALWAVDSWAIALEIAPGSQRQHGAAIPQTPEREIVAGNAPGPTMSPLAQPAPSPPTSPSSQFAPQPFASPPPVVVYPRNETSGGESWVEPAPPHQTWQTPVSTPPPVPMAPQPYAQPCIQPANISLPPKHNSFLAGGICLGAALVMGLLISAAPTGSGLVTFLGVLTFLFGLPGAAEIVLGFVRVTLEKPQPPAFVISSLSFWMTLFGVEDRILSIFVKKQGAQFPAGAPAPYPAATPPQYYSQPPQASAPDSSFAPPPPPPPPPPPAAVPSSGQASTGNVFCIACGTTNGAGAVFCLSCGERLYYPEAPQGAAPN
jgi:hypothetical protein